MGDDVGNWFDTLGVISVVAEVGAVLLAAVAIRRASSLSPTIGSRPVP